MICKLLKNTWYLNRIRFLTKIHGTLVVSIVNYKPCWSQYTEYYYLLYCFTQLVYDRIYNFGTVYRDVYIVRILTLLRDCNSLELIASSFGSSCLLTINSNNWNATKFNSIQYCICIDYNKFNFYTQCKCGLIIP